MPDLISADELEIIVTDVDLKIIFETYKMKDYEFEEVYWSYKDYLPKDEPFMLTYGDGLGDINLKKLLEFHKSHDKLATITAISMTGRFGVLGINDDESIYEFAEKRKETHGWINGGFMVLEPEVIDYIEGDETIFERAPLENLAKDGEIKAFKHPGFWNCMDTKRDHDELLKLWDENRAPWFIWK